MSSLIDSHCHLYCEPYISNIEKIINDCKKNNVNKLLSIGVDIKTSKTNIELASKYDEIFCTVGVHPNETSKINLTEISILPNLIKNNKKILAVGEIGLDFYRNSNKQEQYYFFEEQIEIAVKYKLPIVVHTRNAENETIKILKKYTEDNLKFLIHCFSGSESFANEILKIGGYISFSGIITFKNSNSLKDICKKIPIDRILIETDSPYLSPHPFRGKINHPSNVLYVAKTLAELKNLSLDKICDVTYNNFYNFFK